MPKILGLGLAIIYLSFSSFFLVKINTFWSSSNKVIQGLYDSYQWDNEEHVFLLNLPENLYGVYMFRDHSGAHQSFHSALKYLDQRKIKGQITEIIQYNLTKTSNGATVEQISKNQIKVELKDWGSWWWRKNFTPPNYETDLYRFSSKGKQFTLTLKKDIPDAVFLYHDSLIWKEFKFDSSRSFGE